MPTGDESGKLLKKCRFPLGNRCSIHLSYGSKHLPGDTGGGAERFLNHEVQGKENPYWGTRVVVGSNGEGRRLESPLWGALRRPDGACPLGGVAGNSGGGVGANSAWVRLSPVGPWAACRGRRRSGRVRLPCGLREPFAPPPGAASTRRAGRARAGSLPGMSPPRREAGRVPRSFEAGS